MRYEVVKYKSFLPSQARLGWPESGLERVEKQMRENWTPKQYVKETAVLLSRIMRLGLRGQIIQPWLVAQLVGAWP